jgi:8-oxo-dGTP pyrophosphatase MutT (NUDIX family)
VTSQLDDAYGGVMFDSDGRVLLREPRNHYDGNVWTFSKGRPQPGETQREAALRETREETGVFADIVDRVPGTFPGTVTETTYFLMRPTGLCRPPDTKETWSVRWATPDEARELIKETTNPKARERDLAVLEEALALRRRLERGT